VRAPTADATPTTKQYKETKTMVIDIPREVFTRLIHDANETGKPSRRFIIDLLKTHLTPLHELPTDEPTKGNPSNDRDASHT